MVLEGLKSMSKQNKNENANVQETICTEHRVRKEKREE